MKKYMVVLPFLFACVIPVLAQNVGIGTNSPNARLHIVLNSTLSLPQLKLEENQGSDYARLRFSNSVATARYWDIAGFISSSSFDQDRLNLYNSQGGDLVTVTGSGKVGIGITNPVYRLDVNGNLNFNESLNINGSTGVPGQVPTTNSLAHTVYAFPTKLLGDSSITYTGADFYLQPGDINVAVPFWTKTIYFPGRTKLELDAHLTFEGVSCFSCGDSYFEVILKVTRLAAGGGYEVRIAEGSVANAKKQSIDVVAPFNGYEAGYYQVELDLTHVNGPAVHLINNTVMSYFFLKPYYMM